MANLSSFSYNPRCYFTSLIRLKWVYKRFFTHYHRILCCYTTAFAISELAMNEYVKGDGRYFIILRSFGLNIRLRSIFHKLLDMIAFIGAFYLTMQANLHYWVPIFTNTSVQINRGICK